VSEKVSKGPPREKELYEYLEDSLPGAGDEVHAVHAGPVSDEVFGVMYARMIEAGVALPADMLARAVKLGLVPEDRQT
jgi:hypothetical protein